VLSTPITVVATSATVDAPAEVVAGTEFDVAWTGPDGPGDYVTIVPVGAANNVYESYFETRAGSPGTLVASVEAGDYEVRYVAGADSAVVVAVPIEVTPFQVTLEAPDAVDAGTDFEVTWTGPNGPRDYMTIAPAGSPVGTYLDYEYTTVGSPITLTAPEESGDFEVRYASDRVPELTFSSIPIEVR
jgi:Ca-activated chloride channel family protein